jgi:hypothetical protein
LGRIEGESEDWRKRVGERGKNELLGKGAMGFSTRERRRVKGVRVGMRG